MSLRWRISGELLCGAKSEPMPDDTYIDDRLHYYLSLTGVIDPRADEAKTGFWDWREPRAPHWKAETPDQTATRRAAVLKQHLPYTNADSILNAVHALPGSDAEASAKGTGK